MRRILQASLVTSALVVGVLASTSLPVCAQMDQRGDIDAAISFDSFQDQLAPYGYWLYSDRWGVVWQPSQVPYDFRPYYNDGRWIYTDDYGWYWQSDYPWGDIPFHFGRWVNDPEDGWLWIPGYIWSPAWVGWRTNGAFIGWMPLPPDDAFLEGRGDIGIGVRFGGFDIGALYSRWYGPAWNQRRFAENWVFVPAGYVAAPDFRRVVIRDPLRIVNIIRQTRNVTNYTVVNNVVVNRGIDVRIVERAAGRPIPPVRAVTVIRRPNLVARVDVGERVQMRMRDVVPRGRGMANSAPPPPARVVARLSADVAPRNGRAPVHLFTRATVAAPEAQARFRGTPVRGPAPGAGGEMTGTPGMRPGRGNGPEGNGGRTRPEQAPPGANGGRNPPEQPTGPIGPGGSMQTEQPGATGPSGGPMRPERQSSPRGPGAGSPQGEAPNGPGGPGGGRARPEQPNGPTGPGGGSMQTDQLGDGATGPGGPMRPERQSGPRGPGAGSPQGEPPNGPPAPGGGRMRPEQPNAMTGPNAERPQPQQQPNGASGPSGGANPQANPPSREQKKKKPQNPPQNPPQ